MDNEQRITRHEFLELMGEFGYQFNEDYEYYNKDGALYLSDNYIMCVNYVIYDSYKSYVKIKYPLITDDLEQMRQNYDNDFMYHLSYISYRDYVNLNQENYNSSFYSNLLDYYV